MPPNSSLSRLFRPSICSSCRQSMRKGQQASLSTSSRLAADEPTPATKTASNPPSAPASETDSRDSYAALRDIAKGIEVAHMNRNRQTSSTGMMGNIDRARSDVSMYRPGQESTAMPQPSKARREPHHLHIYAHKHNTHIVLTRPNREPILSFSAGNLGFRKGQRGSFDAGFQLAAYVMRNISDKGLLRSARDSLFAERGVGGRRIEAPIRDLEVILKGFGKGREAVVKALLGTEGKFLRDRIIMVSDDTKTKFGGTRGMNPRRLG